MAETTPYEAIFDDSDFVNNTVPFANEFGAGPEPRRSRRSGRHFPELGRRCEPARNFDPRKQTNIKRLA